MLSGNSLRTPPAPAFEQLRLYPLDGEREARTALQRLRELVTPLADRYLQAVPGGAKTSRVICLVCGNR